VPSEVPILLAEVVIQRFDVGVGLHSYKDAPHETWQWQNRLCYTCIMNMQDHDEYDTAYLDRRINPKFRKWLKKP